MRECAVYVVRVWLGRAGSDAFCASVRRVDHEQSAFFRDAADLTQFLSQAAAEDATASRADPSEMSRPATETPGNVDGHAEFPK